MSNLARLFVKISLSIILLLSGFTVCGQVKKSHLNSPGKSDSVSSKPEFPGGKAGLNAFLARNLRWPTQDCAQAIVFVQFRVNNDGLITQTKVLKRRFKPFDNEALRVVKLMPRWKPAYLHKKPVASTYVLPIRFVIEE